MSSRSLHIIIRIESLSERVRAKKLLAALSHRYSIVLVTKSIGQQAGQIADLPEGVTWKQLPVRTRAGLAKLIEYSEWVLAVRSYLKVLKKADIVWLIGFESAIAHILMNASYQCVFDNSDNISMSYRWPRGLKLVFRMLERQISKVSDLTVIPGTSRDIGFHRVALLRNSPSLQDLALVRSSSERISSRPQSSIWRFYLCGWIRRSRGATFIREALDMLYQYRKDFELIIAGANIETAEREILTRPYVKYLGGISSGDSLVETKKANFIFAFYDPAIEINRVAEPNKWIDAITVGTPFFTNYGIETAEQFKDAGMVQLKYGDGRELCSRLLGFMENSGLYESLRLKVIRTTIPPWEEQVNNVVERLEELRCSGCS